MTNFLDVASAIGRRICRDAIWADGCCNWIGPFGDTGNPYDIRYRSFAADLWSGTSGVALFLASLACFDDEPILRRTAEGAAQHAFRHAFDQHPRLQIGVYVGTLGVAWSLIRIGEQLGSQCWRERGLELLDRIDFDRLDAGTDIISGYSGAIPVLLELSRRYDRPTWLEVALRSGSQLECTAARTTEGWSWKTIDIHVERNLTGFAHGTAGIGWALAQLYQATSESRFRHAAVQAFQYERTFYSEEFKNWPDFRQYLRPAGSSPSFGTAWCHGAPGIALSRLRAWRLGLDAQVREEAEIAIATTKRNVESAAARRAGFCLCHGCAGNADILLEAAREFNAPDFRILAEKIGNIGLESFESQRRPWPCGVPGAGESANLMVGTAGIGYFYLRLVDATLPTLLMIE